MARIVDEGKLLKVKQTLLNIIVRDGSSNASIAKIAKEASVSSGYLYIHYNSKESLLDELYLDKFNTINIIFNDSFVQSNTLNVFLYNFYSKMVELTNSNKNDVLFLFKMITDYSIKLPELIKNQMFDTLDKFRSIYNKELNLNITNELLFIQIIGNILFFINMRMRTAFTPNKITTHDINALSEMVLKSLK